LNVLNKLVIINVLTSEYCDLLLIDLIILKTQSGLSNKKWDKAIKGLTKHGIAKVNKTDDGLFVQIM
jgi:lysyl-tRNA synthetase class 2